MKMHLREAQQKPEDWAHSPHIAQALTDGTYAACTAGCCPGHTTDDLAAVTCKACLVFILTSTFADTRAAVPCRLTPDSALLAGLSMLTVLNLKHSSDEYMTVTHAGPDERGKYSGWLTTLVGRTMFNTESCFDTPEEAEVHIRRVIGVARNWNVPLSTH